MEVSMYYLWTLEVRTAWHVAELIVKVRGLEPSICLKQSDSILMPRCMVIQASCISSHYYNNVVCEHCEMKLPQTKKIAFSRTKRMKSGFWCLACSLDKHLITDKQVMNFLTQKQQPRVPHTKREIVRYWI